MKILQTKIQSPCLSILMKVGCFRVQAECNLSSSREMEKKPPWGNCWQAAPGMAVKNTNPINKDWTTILNSNIKEKF